MKVLLLAAGRSKRMQPIKDKNFLNFIGKPLLVHQMEMLAQNGFNEIILVAGAHNLEKLTQLADSTDLNIEVVEQEDLDKGMCGAVLSSSNAINGEPILIVSSNDVVEDKAFKLMKETVHNETSESYILGKKVENYFPGGYLEIGDDGMIKSIVEKPEPGTEPSNLVNLVVHYHKNSEKLIEYLKNSISKNDDLYEVALDKMIKDGVKMQAVEYDGVWQPIKYPWHVFGVFKHFFESSEKNIADSAQISDKAIIKGDVIIGENVKIFEGAIINGPVYIGDNSIIANNALVRDSHIGENCVIGFNTEVARSFLGNDVWTHTNYIGDSVIGNNVSFGAGTITGNFRLDEGNICVECNGKKTDSGSNKFGLITGDDIRVGVNTSFMPGIKVGSQSFIGAGIVVAENIQANSFVRGKWKLKISENKIDMTDSNRDDIKGKL